MLRSIAIFLLALGVCAPAVARPLVAIDVVDRGSGVRLPQFPHWADRWIKGDPGHDYLVQLTGKLWAWASPWTVSGWISERLAGSPSRM